MKSEENNDLNSWDDYVSGKFLKSNLVKHPDERFICISVEGVDDLKDNTKRLRLIFEKDKSELLFDLNKTNAKFIKDSGIKTPRDCIGKSFYFKKVAVIDPTKKIEVEGLRIWKIEK